MKKSTFEDIFPLKVSAHREIRKAAEKLLKVDYLASAPSAHP